MKTILEIWEKIDSTTTAILVLATAVFTWFRKTERLVKLFTMMYSISRRIINPFRKGRNMPRKTVSVEIMGSGYDLTKSQARVAAAIKKALADGWQPGTDLPAIVTAEVQELGTVAAAIPQLSPDAKEDLLDFVKGINIAAYDFVEVFTEKKAEAVVPEAPQA